MNEHTIVTTYKSEGGTSTVKTQVIQAEQSTNIEVEVPGLTTNLEIVIVIPLTTLKAILIAATKKTGDSGTFTLAMVYTNAASTGAPADTFTIAPGNALVWATGDAAPNPIGTAITKLFVSNPGSAACNLVVRALNDPTP